MNDIQNAKEAARFLAASAAAMAVYAAVSVIAWLVIAPLHFIETVAPLGAVLVGVLS